MDLTQITVEVQDFHQSVGFYSMLGLRLIVSERDEYARFELPSGSTTFSIYVSEQPLIGNTVIYFEVEDVDASYAQLCDIGIEFDGSPTDQNWRWREVHFKDPSGNNLCLYHAGIERRFPPWRLSD